MAGGLAALLDDIAAIARVAATSVDDIASAAVQASGRAVGVVVDDTAVTPQYVQGFTPERELPVIWKIAKGSLINKLLIILPVILLLDWLVPVLLTILLMVGGAYLCFEGVEKLWEALRGRGHSTEEQDLPAVVKGADYEKSMVKGAIRTDLILSAEIMVISFNELGHLSFGLKAATMVIVGIAITALVYGVVAMIVKMDDIGLKMATKSATRGFGEGLVKAMPIVLNVLSTVGIAAMLWVGGHIILAGSHALGFHPVYEFVHHLEEAVGDGLVGWLVNTFFSAIIGVVLGAIIVVILHFLHIGAKHPQHSTAAKH